MKTELQPRYIPYNIDADLAGVVYGSRFDELARFFFRRTENPEIAAALLAETFAKAAQIRQKRTDRPAHDQKWLMSIATIELSRYFRAGKPANKAVEALGMPIPELTAAMIERLAHDPQTSLQTEDATGPRDLLVLV